MTHACGVVLAARPPRILPQHFDQAGEFGGVDRFAKLIGEVDCKLVPRCVFYPSAVGVGMAIGEGDIGLDIENWRAISQVGPEDVQHGARVRAFHSVELHAA